MKNNGIKNEMEIISYLNGKKKWEVHIIFQELLEKLYPDIKANDVIMACKYHELAKCDILLKVNGVKKGISVKSGFKNSVHTEKIDKFLHDLKIINFTKVDELARYLYSDGSNNNTGDNRISSSEYKEKHKEEIEEINKELNKKEIKKYLIERFLIDGNIDYSVTVDAFIYGTLYDFVWFTKEEAMEQLLSFTNIESLGTHVSNLFIQQWNKNLVRNPNYERFRNYIQVKWYSLMEDSMLIICKRYR